MNDPSLVKDISKFLLLEIADRVIYEYRKNSYISIKKEVIEEPELNDRKSES